MDHTDYGYEKNRYISTGRALENTYNGSLKVLISEKSKVDNYGQTLEERINRIDAIKYFLIKLNVSITNRIEIAKNDANLLNYENKNFTQADLERTFGEIDEHIENRAHKQRIEDDIWIDTVVIITRRCNAEADPGERAYYIRSDNYDNEDNRMPEVVLL